MMITILVLGYAYIVWLFTGVNPMPHLNSDLILLFPPELILELIFGFGVYFLFQFFRGATK